MALTTSWVTYKTISVTLPTGYTSYVYIQAKLNSQSTANNTSNVSVRARVKYGYPWYAASAIKIRAGKGSSSGSYNEYTHTYTSSSKATTTEHTTASWTGNISHNQDGTGTLPLYGYIYQKEWGVNKSTTGSVALPTIPRASLPTITPNPFNIGDTITINTNRKVQTYTDDLFMNIGSDVEVLGTDVATTIQVDTSQYANQIYALIPNATSYTSTIDNSTYDGETFIGSNSISYTANVVDSEPTFTLGYRDTNSTTTAITGNNQQIIRNQSTLQINITNASALYGASLVSASVDINGNIYTGSFSGSSLNINVGTVDLSSNENAVVTVTDSRGLTTTKSVELQILNWELPSAIIECARQNNYYTETNVKVDADYSSLDSHNTITITFKYKKTTDSTYTTTTLQDNVSTVINMDNLYDWDIQVIVADAFGSTTYNLTLNKGVPLIFFDRKRESVSIGCFPQRDETIEVYGVDLLQDKQDTLVSGTNIKTINNTSLLGSGNINISSGGTATDVEINGTSITSNNTANIAVDGTYNASTNKIATMSSLPSAGTSATAVDTTSSGGSASTYSKSDHKHSISSGTITSALGYTPYSSANPNGYTSNTGTITSVKMNGTTIASSGEADLGTVITSHQNIKTINNESLVGTGNINLVTSSDLSNYVLSSSLSTVATTGDYDDLTNKPTIPTVGNTKIYYGTSSTSAGTQTKTVTCSGFTLETGATIFVKFTYGQTYNGVPKLNVNGTGAINVRYKGDTNGIRYMWSATEVMGFTYDGTYWVAIGRALATTTYYGVTKLTDSASSTSTTTSLTPASLNRAMQYTVTGYPVYSSSSTYAVGDKCRYGNYMYECNTAITTAESWTAAHWTALPDLQTQINGKQATLVSGTNIKTINNESILGSGNISISGGQATDVQVNGTSIVSNNVANLVTESAYNSSTNKIATMLDLPEGIVTLTNTNIRIWGLEAGLYKVPFSCQIYYNGASGTEKELNEIGNMLLITKPDNNSTVWFLFGSFVNEVILHGVTSSSSGNKAYFYLKNYLTSITGTMVTNALGYTPYNSSNPNGYISGITSSDVTTALGYTPYNSTNPNGYTSNTGTITEVQAYGTTVSSSGVANIPRASTSAYGVTQLSNATDSNLQYIAASSYAVKKIADTVAAKQDTLVSGTNIKTINGTSVLGSGDITVGGGGTATNVLINGTTITSNNEADIKVDGTYNATTNKIATMSSLPTIDTAMSTTSTNPVQNKVIKSAIDSAVEHSLEYSSTDNYILKMTDNTTANLYSVPTIVTGTSNISIAQIPTASTLSSSTTTVPTTKAVYDAIPTVPSAGTTATAVGTSSSGGSASTYSKSDHKHSISSSTITSALGYTPYNSTNPNNYISGITSSMVTTALGYTPYNSTNPNGYITGISGSDVTTALGYTPQAQISDTGWNTLTLASGFSAATGTPSSTPQYRKVGNHVYIRGLIKFTRNSSTQVFATAASGYIPSAWVYKIACLQGTRYARIGVNPESGQMFIDWVYPANGTSAVTSGSITWLDITMDWFTD